MGESEARPGGPFASLRRLGDSVLGLLQTRLELAAVELHEEKLRLFDLLLRVAIFVVLSVIAIVTATALVVVLLWDYSRGWTLGVITAVYGLAALVLWLDLKKRVDTAPPPFTDTIEEFKKDAECLQVTE